ncbi:DUF2716 domain-containing protein [Rhodococcus spelaei]|uniref:DUF2716 domain-containing protein n=1 Tax=Rhodococcus spelaei TaxID=2546320 RepID=A0A541BPE6_9NOCA|nr:DUF2716 domain-containing protein [Rhodococcus spelaei]TQF74118.1 DUF2716 domain-containing protein [Rhodococcus spelaei]
MTLDRDRPSSGRIWTPIDRADKVQLWSDFNKRYKFQPGLEPEDFPGIAEPVPSITFKLAKNPTKSAYRDNFNRINMEALQSFQSIVPAGREMIALDWQHPCFRFMPSAVESSNEIDWKIPVYPNGDYYIFVTESLNEGTFGHPWEHSICVFGSQLVDELGSRLGKWLTPIRIDGKST